MIAGLSPRENLAVVGSGNSYCSEMNLIGANITLAPKAASWTRTDYITAGFRPTIDDTILPQTFCHTKRPLAH